VPSGISTILPETAQRVRRLEERLLTTLSAWGYREIIPPTFEYLDVLSPGLEPEVIEACYKFADPTTGRILLLRPDVTAQIARIVAMGMLDEALPLRLSYRTTVYRCEPEHAGRERELFQVGAELIGVDDVAMDAEIIGLMSECLKQVGLSDFTISLGHVGFFKALVARAGLSPEGRKKAEQAAAHKDLPRLEEMKRRAFQLDAFFRAGAPFEESAFILCGSKPTERQAECIEAIREALWEHKIFARHLAEGGAAFLSDPWDNAALYMTGCRYGVALLEGMIRTPPAEVVYQAGFMRGHGAPLLVLWDRAVQGQEDVAFPGVRSPMQDIEAYGFDPVEEGMAGMRERVKTWIEALLKRRKEAAQAEPEE